MKTVELIYDNDCPNVEQTRAHLLQTFSEAAIPARWIEWDRGDSSSPSYVLDYGSPTVLVDGQDVAGIEPSGNISCCRLYPAEDGGFSGVPSVEMIRAALGKTGNEAGPKMGNEGAPEKSDEQVTAGGYGSGSKDGDEPVSESGGKNPAPVGGVGMPEPEGNGIKPSPVGGRRKPTGWRSSLAVLPGIGASLLPVGVCPACLPIYAGLLSSFGLGFLLKSAYLMPLTALFLAIAVAGLAYKAKTRRGYRPFLLGLAGSTIVLAGKFIFGIDTAMYIGIAVLIAASLWNAWPRKNARTGEDTCPACVSRGTDAVTDTQGNAE